MTALAAYNAGPRETLLAGADPDECTTGATTEAIL